MTSSAPRESGPRAPTDRAAPATRTTTGGGAPSSCSPPARRKAPSVRRLVGGQVQEAGVLDPRGQADSLPAEQAAALLALPVDGQPHTRDLGGDLGDYRLMATQEQDGDVLVTGLPLGDVQDTVYRLAAVAGVVALLGLLVAGLAGAAIIRLALQPLRRVAGTARARLRDASGPRRGRAGRARPGRGHRPAHGGRSGGLGHQRDARARRGGPGRASGQRDAGAPVRGRREPRAAHAAGGHSRVRRADPPEPGGAPGGRRARP